VLGRIREWRIDRMTDRVARRPHGRAARQTYGADDVHSFVWEPVLEALQLTPDDALLDVGCGGGVFLRRALESGCRGVGLDHSRDMVRLARKTTRTCADRPWLGRCAPVRRRRVHRTVVADRVLLFPRPARGPTGIPPRARS
jgi:SAM-dependent methyltransferase